MPSQSTGRGSPDPVGSADRRAGWPTDAGGAPCGVHFQQPALQTLQRLSALLDGANA